MRNLPATWKDILKCGFGIFDRNNRKFVVGIWFVGLDCLNRK